MSRLEYFVDFLNENQNAYPKINIEESQGDETFRLRLVAKQDIKAGELVLLDTVQYNSKGSGGDIALRYKLANKIVNRPEFLQLCTDRPLLKEMVPGLDQKSPEFVEAFKVVCSNSFQCPSNGAGGVWIGLITSLINHSCFPNCVMLCEKGVYAKSFIAAGEEITINYFSADDLFPINMRQELIALDRGWKSCQCKFCTNPDNEVDKVLLDGDAQLPPVVKLTLKQMCFQTNWEKFTSKQFDDILVHLDNLNVAQTHWSRGSFYEQAYKQTHHLDLKKKVGWLWFEYLEQVAPANNSNFTFVYHAIPTAKVKTHFPKAFRGYAFYNRLEKQTRSNC